MNTNSAVNNDMNNAAEEIQNQHVFDQAIALAGEPECRVGSVSADYQNMVGPFGGVTAATILNSVLTHPERVGSPVALTINFLGPINKLPTQLDVKLLRTNRSNQHWSIELVQGEEVQCSATCVTAKRRDTWNSNEMLCPEAPSFVAMEGAPAIPAVAPWVKQYDFRFVSGSPFGKSESDSEEKPSESLLWISDKPARKLDFTSLTAIADAFFPRIVLRRKKMVPFGTVSLTIHFHVTEDELNGLSSGAVLGHARASKFSGSYHDQTAELWSEDHTLLATTSQMVYYKD